MAVSSRAAAAATAVRCRRAQRPEPGRRRVAVGRDRLVGQPALDLRGQLGRRGVAVLGPPGHRLEADRLQRRGAAGQARPRRGRLLLAGLADRLVGRRVAERGPAGEDLVEDRPEAVDVGARADHVGPPLGLLRGHVARRAQDLARQGRSRSPASARRPRRPRPVRPRAGRPPWPGPSRGRSTSPKSPRMTFCPFRSRWITPRRVGVGRPRCRPRRRRRAARQLQRPGRAGLGGRGGGRGSPSVRVRPRTNRMV